MNYEYIKGEEDEVGLLWFKNLMRLICGFQGFHLGAGGEEGRGMMNISALYL